MVGWVFEWKVYLISYAEPFHSACIGYYLKNWANRYPFLSEIKGFSMQIQPLKLIVTSNFQIERMFNGSVFVAVHCRFDKIYISGQGTLEIIKRETCEPNHQFLSVPKMLNYVSQEVPAPRDVHCPSVYLRTGINWM